MGSILKNMQSHLHFIFCDMYNCSKSNILAHVQRDNEHNLKILKPHFYINYGSCIMHMLIFITKVIDKLCQAMVYNPYCLQSLELFHPVCLMSCLFQGSQSRHVILGPKCCCMILNTFPLHMLHSKQVQYGR